MIRYYCTEFGLLPNVLIRDPLISPQSYNGWGLIPRTWLNSPVIICLSHNSHSLFICFRCTKMQIKQNFYVDFGLSHVNCLHMTSSNKQHLEMTMIASLHSEHTISGYQHGRQIISLQERAYHICILCVITANIVSNMSSWIFNLQLHPATASCQL